LRSGTGSYLRPRENKTAAAELHTFIDVISQGNGAALTVRSCTGYWSEIDITVVCIQLGHLVEALSNLLHVEDVAVDDLELSTQFLPPEKALSP